MGAMHGDSGYTAACTGATMSVPDTLNNTGGSCSVAMGADGLGLVSHRQSSTDSLMAAHCANLLCNPYVAQRQ
jgi:hypothetical protein